MFPGDRLVELSVNHDGTIDLYYHGNETYRQATEWLRSLGAGVRNKRVTDGFTVLTGTVGNVCFRTYPDELPPSCRKVKKIERIPKTAVVQTGEYIEVEREVIECGPEVSA